MVKSRYNENAILALAHFNEVDATPELKKVATTDERPMIRATAYWAIGQILGEEARDFINANYDQEECRSSA